MRRRSPRWLSCLFALSLLATACGGGDGEGQAATTTSEAAPRKGGEIVLAAEQWPKCLNTITSCANSSWTGWSVTNYVLPQAMEIDERGKFVPSPLLAGEPKIEETPKFKLTYELDPKAVWDDGTPITSADFEFTWKARLSTTGSLTKVGYEKIASIDTSDPATVVITFKEPYADWADIFGGNQHNVLKKAAFKSANVKDDMLTGIPFSGGPFKLESWSPEEAVLVRNDKYWDPERVPLLDKVTMVPRTDQDTEITALLTGEVAAITPQPAPGFAQKIKNPNVKYQVGGAVQFEGLWFNLERDPVKDRAVREALFYGVDRQAVVDTVVAQIVPGQKVLNCAGWVPTVGEWCDNSDFADFSYDPEKSKSILTAAGWKAGADGIFAKDGKRLTIQWNTVAGNKRREDTQALVKEHLKKAGIEVTIKNFDAGELFDNKLPKKDYTMAEYAQVASPDPGVTTIYSCDAIPSAKNNYEGQNSIAWCNNEADRLMKESDKAVDPAKRLELIRKVGDLVRSDVVWLPLYQLPTITAWRTDRLAGPIGKYTSSTNQGYFNIWDWGLK